MERLTYEDDKGNWGVVGLEWSDVLPFGRLSGLASDRILAMARRLKEYEDTGLTPDQIRQIDTLYAEKCREVEKYKSINEEGRLVILPCKAGDVLFCFSRRKIYPFEVRCIRIYKERIEIELWYAGDEENLKFWHISVAEQDIGYKFFFTYEEAEKALEEMK